jgi:hypothetical protein
MQTVQENSQKKSQTKAFDRKRIEKSLSSGEPIKLPQGLSKEEIRDFILNNS